MAGGGDPQRIIENLREQVQNLTQERNQLRRLYDAEVVENEQLARIRQNLRTNYEACLNANNRLRNRIGQLKAQLAKHEPKNYRKKWEDLCVQTRRKRKAEYHQVFDSALQTVPECKKARIHLSLGHDRIRFEWSTDDMANCRDAMRQKGISVPDPPPVESEDESDETDTTDTRSPQTIKEEIIHMMDRYRISQDAYHELQQTLKKLPLTPMHRLKVQKKKMSEEIPFEKYPDVSRY